MTPVMEAYLIVFAACGVVAAFGFYWAKQEREERLAQRRQRTERTNWPADGPSAPRTS